MMPHLSDGTARASQQLTLWHLVAAVVVLVVPLVVLVCRSLACGSKFDAYSLTLVLVSLLPPLSMFFVRIKLPGGIQVDSRAREGSTRIADQAREVRTAVRPPEPAPYSPGLAARKVLATLHRYQQQLFPSEPDKRWTFAVGEKSTAYGEFKQGVDELVGNGIAALTSEGHVYLTSEGLEAAKQLSGQLESSPYYQF